MKRMVMAAMAFAAMLSASANLSAQDTSTAQQPKQATEQTAPEQATPRMMKAPGAPQRGMVAPTSEQMAKQRTEMLSKKLSLNDEQSAQLYKLNLKEAKQHQKVMTAAQKQREAYNTQLKKIVGDENYAKIQEMQAKRMRQQDGKGNCPQMRKGNCPKQAPECNKKCDRQGKPVMAPQRGQQGRPEARPAMPQPKQEPVAQPSAE